MSLFQLHLVCGPPAVGKTTYGLKLAKQLGACFLDSDQVTELLIQSGMKAAGLDPDDRDSDDYKAIYRRPVYETLFRLAEQNLALTSVVVAGPFTSEIGNPNWKEELEVRFQQKVELHILHCEPKERKRRMKVRGEARDLAKLAHWEEYLIKTQPSEPQFDCYFGLESPPVIVL